MVGGTEMMVPIEGSKKPLEKWIKVLGLSLLGLIFTAGLVFAGYQLGQRQTRHGTIRNLALTPSDPRDNIRIKEKDCEITEEAFMELRSSLKKTAEGDNRSYLIDKCEYVKQVGNGIYRIHATVKYGKYLLPEPVYVLAKRDGNLWSFYTRKDEGFCDLLKWTSEYNDWKEYLFCDE